MLDDANLHCPRHRLVAGLAWGGGVAADLRGVVPEELPHDLLRGDLVRHVAQVPEVPPRAGPGVPAAHDLDERHVRAVLAVRVQRAQHLAREPLPDVALAAVEAGPALHGVVHGGDPVVVAHAVVGVHGVPRAVEGDDGQGPGGIVGQGEAEAADHCDACDEARELRREPRAEARAAGEAGAADALHVHVELVDDLLEHGHGVAHVVGAVRVLLLRVQAHVEVAMQCFQRGKREVVLLRQSRHIAHFEEDLR
mmetsp:Transcript_65358/g.210673  ORF Transcript_65358/g.210673 Transcript_65358/m.210673 type:complete len:252 (-) Transcript_65358:189-944(-)